MENKPGATNTKKLKNKYVNSVWAHYCPFVGLPIADCYLRQGDGGTKTAHFSSKILLLR